MAIAYYIPDQAKLAEKQKPKVIKSVKIPLNNYTLSSNLCWELMAQVFCYALRYHHLTAGNGTLQISVEFSQQSPAQHGHEPSADSMKMKTDEQDDDDDEGSKN